MPPAFTAAQIPLLAVTGDPRLALAAGAEGGRVIQFLAGVPDLTARYRNAPPASAALIDAAMDARRLGMGIVLPLAFLEYAAPGYLTHTEWDGLGDDWIEQGLAYATAPCQGIRGPLARFRPRPDRDPAPSSPAYRLADYLEQHGGHARSQRMPPASFWAASARFADPGDLPVLADAAEDRGLLRDAACLRKRAIGLGDIFQAAVLVLQLHNLNPRSPDPSPAQWAVERRFARRPARRRRAAEDLQEGRRGRAGRRAAGPRSRRQRFP